MQNKQTTVGDLKLGQVVESLPEYQDPGDSEFTWVVVEEEATGRLVISPLTSTLRIHPRYPVEREWVRPVDTSAQRIAPP